MIDLTRLLEGLDNRPDQIKYGKRRASDAVVPLVVWNSRSSASGSTMS